MASNPWTNGREPVASMPRAHGPTAGTAGFGASLPLGPVALWPCRPVDQRPSGGHLWANGPTVGTNVYLTRWTNGAGVLWTNGLVPPLI